MYAIDTNDPELKDLLIFAYISRAEKLEAEIRELNLKKSQVFKEARVMGLDDDAMRQLMRLRRNNNIPTEVKSPELITYEKAFHRYELKHKGLN